MEDKLLINCECGFGHVIPIKNIIKQTRADVIEELRLEAKNQAIDGAFKSTKQDGSHYRDWVGETISLSDLENILTKLSKRELI